MDALGWSLTRGGRDPGFITVDGESVYFRIIEPAKQTDAVDHRWRVYDYHPSGELRVEILRAYRYRGRKNWVDGKTHVVEDQLPSFFQGVYSVAQDEKESRKKQEEAKRQRIQAERQRQEEERRRKEEDARRQDLLYQSRRYKEARNLRVYIAAVLERGKDENLSSGDERALNEWKEWAHAQADRMDPLLGSISFNRSHGGSKDSTSQ